MAERLAEALLGVGYGLRVPKFSAKILSELVASHVPDPERNPDDVLFTTERGCPRDLLGHSSTDITEGHYAKRPDLIVEVAADALDEAFAGIEA